MRRYDDHMLKLQGMEEVDHECGGFVVVGNTKGIEYPLPRL